MDGKKLLKSLVCLMFLIFIANSLALKFYWYFSVWWSDMLMHFLGGLWEGLFFIWFFSIINFPFFKLSLEVVNFRLIYKTILFVLLIGIFWEFFEFFANNYIGHDPFSILDTVSDVFFDLVGGAFSILYFFFYFKKITPIKENKV